MSDFSVTIEDRIAIVTLTRPPVNSLVKATYQELRTVFERLGSSGEADVAILAASGDIFCGGNDVNEFLGFTGGDVAKDYAAFVRDGIGAIYTCEIPVIAAVQGHAYGAGMAMAACADVIVASEEAQFCIPEIKVGIVGAACFLNLILPEKLTRYLSLTGLPISAKEVQAHGGVQHVVPKTQVMATAQKVAKAMLLNAPSALRYFKAAMNENQNAQLADQYDREINHSMKLAGTYEAREAVAAFLEKRAPDYSLAPSSADSSGT